MLLTNHTLTGILLGLSLDNPVVLAPTAIASHLALDMTPHFGHPAFAGGFRKTPFLLLGSLDFALSIGVTAAACLIWPTRAGHILIGVAGADLPDFTYIPVIIFGRRKIEHWFGFYRPMLNFLAKIQWFEKPSGAVTEIVWALLMLSLLHSMLPAPS